MTTGRINQVDFMFTLALQCAMFNLNKLVIPIDYSKFSTTSDAKTYTKDTPIAHTLYYLCSYHDTWCSLRWIMHLNPYTRTYLGYTLNTCVFVKIEHVFSSYNVLPIRQEVTQQETSSMAYAKLTHSYDWYRN